MSSLLYHTNDIFDGVPISMAAHVKSEAESFQRILEIVRLIDEKRHIRDLLFLAEFAKKQESELRCSGPKEPKVKELVCVGIDRGVQPVILAIDTNHRLVDRVLIRINVAIGLELGLPNSVVNRGVNSLDTQTIKILFSIIER
jgi:hypothetical protein